MANMAAWVSTHSPTYLTPFKQTFQSHNSPHSQLPTPPIPSLAHLARCHLHPKARASWNHPGLLTLTPHPGPHHSLLQMDHTEPTPGLPDPLLPSQSISSTAARAAFSELSTGFPRSWLSLSHTFCLRSQLHEFPGCFSGTVTHPYLRP